MFSRKFLSILFGAMLMVVGGAALRISADDDKVGSAEILGQQAKEEAKLRGLLPELVKTMRVYHEATRAAFETRQVPFAQFVQTFRELRDAELQLAKTAEDRIQVCKRMVQNAKAYEGIIEAKYQAGESGGEAEKYNHIKAVRLQAEIDLCREQIASLAGR
jgi:hypothetical protein